MLCIHWELSKKPHGLEGLLDDKKGLLKYAVQIKEVVVNNRGIA